MSYKVVEVLYAVQEVAYGALLEFMYVLYLSTPTALIYQNCQGVWMLIYYLCNVMH